MKKSTRTGGETVRLNLLRRSMDRRANPRTTRRIVDKRVIHFRSDPIHSSRNRIWRMCVTPLLVHVYKASDGHPCEAKRSRWMRPAKGRASYKRAKIVRHGRRSGRSRFLIMFTRALVYRGFMDSGHVCAYMRFPRRMAIVR